jgi:exosortase H (IPTLxxWG-CTERM-specific)
LIFTGCFLLGLALLPTPVLRPAITGFSSALVNVSASLILHCGGNAHAEGPVLRNPTDGFAIEMKDGCNGVTVTMLLWSAILAFPASWRHRAIGLVSGSVAIQVVNFIRFISLFYLGQYNLNWFDFAHHYLWESLIMLDTVVVFWVWVAKIVYRHGSK